jgi:HD-GYP domain-containing protein (c-di-GMP phosphodiesterase class II)
MPIALKSLHGMLIARLLTVTLVVAAVVGAIAGLTERDRVRGLVRDRAVVGASNLQSALQSYLDAPGLGDHAALQATVDAFVEQRRRPAGSFDATGHFVAVRLYNAGFTRAAQTSSSQPEIQAVLASLPPPAAPPGGAPLVTALPEGPHLRVTVPLTNSQGATVAYADGLFEISPQARSDGTWRIARGVAFSVIIVLATTALLYPVIVRLMRRLERLSQDLIEADLDMIQVVGSLIAKRDSDTDVHNFRVTLYSVRIAETMGLDANTIRSLIKGAFLHDVGKVGTPDRILHKPGKLDDAEYTEMKKHVTHGLDVVQHSAWLTDAASVVGGHHEKYDGTGYHGRLKGGNIPQLARIFAVADVFDALTSRRPYKEPMEFQKALDILMKDRGTHFDPEVLDVFAGIARPLYDSFANRDDATPREELARIVHRYFRTDIAVFLE